MNPERSREAMEVVGVVGEQVGPFEASPFPDRLVHVNRASARRGHTAVVAPVHGVGPRALATAGTDAAANVSVFLVHRLISCPHSADASYFSLFRWRSQIRGTCPARAGISRWHAGALSPPPGNLSRRLPLSVCPLVAIGAGCTGQTEAPWTPRMRTRMRISSE